jgi:hypothetical protein
MAEADQLGKTAEDALAKLLDVVRAGIAHGHFEATVIVRDSSAGRTEIIISAGKQFRFLLPKR